LERRQEPLPSAFIVQTVLAAPPPRFLPKRIRPSPAPKLAVQVRVAGVSSRLPALSTALTEKLCSRFSRDEYVFGDEQPSKALPSRLHSNVEPGSLDENSKVAVVPVLSPVGPGRDRGVGRQVERDHVLVGARVVCRVTSIAGCDDVVALGSAGR
jgi:hypothetical protein